MSRKTDVMLADGSMRLEVRHNKPSHSLWFPEHALRVDVKSKLVSSTMEITVKLHYTERPTAEVNGTVRFQNGRVNYSRPIKGNQAFIPLPKGTWQIIVSLS